MRFLNVLQPYYWNLLLLVDGFSVSHKYFNIPKTLLEEAHNFFQQLPLYTYYNVKKIHFRIRN